jgi:hypothetical protein
MDLEALRILLGRHQGDALLQGLVRADARFIVVGGCALAGWGKRPLTAVDDMDLLVEPSSSNARSVLQALSALGQSACFTPAMLAQPNKQLPLKNGSFCAELLTPRAGIQFEEAYALATTVDVFGLEIPIASVATLIRLKELAVASLSTELEKHTKDLLALRGA